MGAVAHGRGVPGALVGQATVYAVVLWGGRAGRRRRWCFRGGT